MTKEQFLLDTIEYYSEDVERRCVDSNGNCTYSGKTFNKNSDGCAIGRWLNEEVRLDLDALGIISVQNSKVFERLPAWMKTFGLSFLTSVQDLHDESDCWDSKGLSKRGKDIVNDMIDYHNLNIPKYK